MIAKFMMVTFIAVILLQAPFEPQTAWMWSAEEHEEIALDALRLAPTHHHCPPVWDLGPLRGFGRPTPAASLDLRGRASLRT